MAGVQIALVRGEDAQGASIFAYVAVQAANVEDFMKAQESGTFYPEDYGVVLATGKGEPTEELIRKIEQDYGIDHDQMVNMLISI
jgi:hypothetical protein